MTNFKLFKSGLSKTVPLVVGLCVAGPALAADIFDTTPLSGTAGWVDARMPSNKRSDNQQLATAPAGGWSATQFDAAKHDSTALAAAIGTLGCADECAALADSVKKPGAVNTIYTTGAILDKDGTEDYQYNFTIVGADKDSGEVGAETTLVTLHTAPPTHHTVHLTASCITQGKRNGSGFVAAYFSTAPQASAPDLQPGDTLSVKAPACHASFSKIMKPVRQATFMYEGGKALSLANPHYEYVAAGPQ